MTDTSFRHHRLLPLLSKKELGQWLGLSRTQIDRLRNKRLYAKQDKDKIFPAECRLGGLVKFDPRDVEDWLGRNRV